MSLEENVINQCKLWLEKIIIDLNFCPFAKKEFVNDTIAYAVDGSADIEEALQALLVQCQRLDDEPAIATTLMIFSEGFQTFDQFLDLIDIAQPFIFSQGYEGTYQIATFHPHYQFGGVAKDDVTNFTNRSPFPILHLIREDDMARAVNAHPDPEGIPERNMDVAREKGQAFFQSFLHQLAKD